MVTINLEREGTIDRLFITTRDSASRKYFGLIDTSDRVAYIPSERPCKAELPEDYGWLNSCDAILAFACLEDDLRKEGYVVRYFG